MHPDPRLLALRDWLRGQVLQGTGGRRFHLRERIGQGGQGWVFTAAWDKPEGYLVIVKVLRPDAVTPESLTRFEREAQVLRMLGQAANPNPHIVRFFDHARAVLPSPAGGGNVELHFTALEYVKGETLENVLSRSRGVGLQLDRTRRIAHQIALALEEVHAHKIVHRDLKPSNVLLASEAAGEIAKVTDFGLVKLVSTGTGKKTTALAGASLGYAPPEQFEQGNRRVHSRTDVFSYAAILYEMLSGTRAFPYGNQENPLVIVTRLLNGPRPSLARLRRSLPQELATRPELVTRLDAVLVRAMAADPGERHASIHELWDAVAPILQAASERGPISPKGMRAAPSPESTPAVAPADASRRPAAHPGTGETLQVISHPSPSQDPDLQLANPAAWKWRVCVPPVRAGAVRAGAFHAAGQQAVALTPTGLLQWEGATWTPLPAAEGLDARSVRGLVWLKAGELVLYGARGLALHLAFGGGLATWEVGDREITFLGAQADPQGTTVTMVGERPARKAMRGGGQTVTMGTLAQFARGRLTLLADAPSSPRLRGVTRLRAGAIVACGDSGEIVRLEMGVAERVGSICGGHLHAIASLGEPGAVTVGAGGHALSLTPTLQAQLEAVQTTRNLLALAVDPAGVAWSGSAQARLLRRTAGSWVRMSGELGLQSSVVAVWAASRTVRAICNDGAIIEGIVA
jgi:eukaryotic-like serine/threonine-protein kinase